jgi:hypothetical protein
MAGNRNQPEVNGELGQENMENSISVVIANDQTTIPVSGSFSVTGGATSDNQTNGDQKTQIVDGAGNVVGVTANALDVNASIDTTGLATSVGQTTGNTSLDNIDTKTPALGTAVMAASAPVTIATDDTMITALDAAVDSIDGKITTCDTGSIAGTVTANAGTNLNTSALALEAGGNLAACATDLAALEVLETTIAGDTTSIDDKTPALGQALEAASVPVVLPAGQITTLTPPAAITNYAEESGGNLDTIAGDTTSLDGKTPALGQALAAASVPVVLTEAQVTTLTPPAAITGFALESGGNLADIKTNTDSIKTAVEVIDNAISGSEMQVDVVAALPAGTNNIGDVDVLTLPGSVQGPGNPTIDSYAHIAINLTTGANQVLVSSAASKQIWVYGYGFTCGDADGQTVSLQDEDDTAVTGVMEFAQYGGISVPPSGNFSMPIFKCATDKDLEVDITGGDVDGFLCYAIVSV